MAIRKLVKGQVQTVRQSNEIAEQARRSANVRGGPGQFFSNTPAGLLLASQKSRPYIVARITATPDDSEASSYYPGIALDCSGYSWVEVLETACGDHDDIPAANRRSGDNGTEDGVLARDPLFEANGDTSIAVGTIVQIWPAFRYGGTRGTYPGQEYVTFGAGVGGGAGGGSSGTCTLPASATELAELSDAGHTPEDNLAHWQDGLGHLIITLSDECCYYQIIRRECSDDGTHVISKRFVIHHSNPVKVSTGPTIDSSSGGESWMDARADACADMTDV